MIKVAIYGASGYTGQELLRLLVRHPFVSVTAVTSRKFKGMPVADEFPAFAGVTDLSFSDASPGEVAAQCDVVFLALPHGEAMAVAPVFLKAGVKVVDLSADFRLRDHRIYENWYIPHRSPDLIQQAVYGLPELYRERIREALLVANPGCYPTSVILGLAPLLRSRLVDAASIIVDSKSGVSGAGREVQLGSLFCEINEGFKAYKIGQHRHTPEIDQELSLLAGEDVRVTFTPHLIPVSRGILSTMYATMRKSMPLVALTALYEDFYCDEKFVRVCRAERFPNISSVRGSNYCDIGLVIDDRTGRVIVVSAIDNLTKGASGQAVQNMNLVCDFPEDAGLDVLSVFP